MFSPFFKLSDMVTTLFMSLYVVKCLNCKVISLNISRYKNILIYLALFLVWSSISATLGKLWFHNSFDYIYRDSRVLLYWAWIPILIYLLSSKLITPSSAKQLLLAIGLSVSTLALIQYTTGVHILGTGRVTELKLSEGEGVVRVQIYGFIFVTLTMIISVAMLASRHVKLPPYVVLLSISILGLYVNFGRAVWIWSAAGVVLLLYFLPIEDAKRLIPKLALFVVIGIGGLYIVNPSAVERAVDRISSVQQEGGKSTSYGWRKLENKEGVNVILRSPFFGVGLGGEYRPWLGEIREFEDHTRYIHNVYLFFAVKLGLPGATLLILVLLNIWMFAIKTIKTTADINQKYLAIGVSAALPVFFMLNITQPELEEPFGVIYLALILSALYIERKPTTLTT